MATQSHQRKPSLGLVDYSDSDDDQASSASRDVKEELPSPSITQTQAPNSGSSSSLPPLPSKFHDLYATAPRLTKEDDPSAHGGRQRAIPHVEGNWPTHIYFEWHLNAIEITRCESLLDAARGVITKYEQFHKDEGAFKLESFLYSDLKTQLPLHISMSRPIVLRTEERDGFMMSLERGVERTAVNPFEVQFTSLEWVPNQDRSRWFWVMRASSPVQSHQRQQSLALLLATCNQVVRRHKQSELYLKDRRGNVRDGFHVSLGWSLTEPTKELSEDILTAVASIQSELAELKMKCDTLKVKIGNAVNTISLEREYT
ncbi:poly(U)-specific 3'-to-5' RNA exonuclease [Orbilia ellipsospora]|uniref:U6 snRNA phosphodiesterase n=1 Tax=Orbilia ellipsospora TaxID=2528407 RepID=A0AAV9XGD4_9PEZI